MADKRQTRLTLRHLCRLGLPATRLLPSLLPVLRELVPASHAGFFFCDAQGRITNLYAERLLPPGPMAAYYDRHDDREFRRQYLLRVAAERPVSRRSVGEVERASTYCRDVLQPLDIAHFLYAVVRHQGRPLGQLSLYRGFGEPPFRATDEQALASVLHYLGQALAEPAAAGAPGAQGAPHPAAAEAAPPSAPALPDEALEDGLAVLDAQGHELYADAHWPRLVRLAHQDAISPSGAMAERDSLPRFVAGVHQALRRAAAGAPAVHRVDTHWGRFVFRRHLLSSPAGAEAVALRVTRHGASPVRLAQGAAALGLTTQQREVAVLAAQGHRNAEIARRLDLSVNTVGYHLKQVFARLGVHERGGVAQRLSSAAGSKAD